MAKTRSPNFPVIDLGDAIADVADILKKEKRGSFPKEAAAAHLGYSSVNGRSLGKIAALRAYGLLEGRGDGLAVSDDAVAILEAPSESEDRREALRRAFEGPPMFQRIQSEYPEKPSYETLKWWLNKAGFNPDGAEKAAAIYLDSFDLVTENLGAYKPAVFEPEAVASAPVMDDTMRQAFSSFLHGPRHTGGGRASNEDAKPKEIAMGVHERVLQSGMLSKEASYRVIVSGKVGVAEINRLLAKLEMDKDILAEPDPTPPIPPGDDIDYEELHRRGESID